MRARLRPTTGRKASLTALLPWIPFAVLILCVPNSAHTQQPVTQSTKGDQSPAVFAPGGQVNIYYISEGKKIEAVEASLAQRPAEDTLAAQARKRLEAGDQEGAENFLKQSLKNNLQDMQQRTKAAAADANELGSLKEVQLDYQIAKTYYEQATQLDPNNPSYLRQLGGILLTLDDPKKAMECYSTALDIDLKVYGDKHPDVAKDYVGLGVAWANFGQDVQRGHLDTAEQYFSKALDIDLNVYGDKHPDVARDYVDLGFTYICLFDSRKAIEYCSKALDIDLQIYGGDHPRVARDYVGLGVERLNSGDNFKALEYFSKALAIDRKVYGENHPDVGVIYNNLGTVWRSLGEPAKAIEYYSKALDIFTVKLGPDHRWTRSTKSVLEATKEDIQSNTPAHVTGGR